MNTPNNIDRELIELVEKNRPNSLYIMHYSWIEQVCKECAKAEVTGIKKPKNFLVEEKILMLIVSYTNSGEGLQRSMKQLAWRTGMTERTVCTALQRLEKWGLITRDKGKGNEKNIYYLTPTAQELNQITLKELNERKKNN